jgi:uncharacterized protein (UPF0332 family)
MTKEIRQKNIEEELNRAKEYLKEINVLLENEFYIGAVSRLYYYVFHSIRALLIKKYYEPKIHEETLRFLGMHFIKPGIIPIEISQIFTKLMKYREELTKYRTMQ